LRPNFFALALRKLSKISRRGRARAHNAPHTLEHQLGRWRQVVHDVDDDPGRILAAEHQLGVFRHYDPTMRPLGKLLVAKSYSTRVGEKTTKTDAVKHVPVHPTLAAMLAEWKLGGWAERMGRAPARMT
jgi:hypothetical protein